MTSTSFDRIEAALTDHGSTVKTEGAGQLRASCPNPFHEHGNRKSPALQVTDHGDKVGIYCHGCDDTPAILGALGMTTKDLFDRPLEGRSDGSGVIMDLPGHDAGKRSRRRSEGRRPRALAAPPPAPVNALTGDQKVALQAIGAATKTDYHYVDGAGEVQFTIHRIDRGPDEKDFYPSRKKAQLLQAGIDPNILYQLPAVFSAVAESRTIFLVEGEKCVDAAGIVGLTATTGRGGCDNIKHVSLDPLRGAHVVAIVDQDSAGDKWAATVRERLTGVAASLQFKRSATTGDGHDLFDHLTAGFSVDQLVDYEFPGEDDGDAAAAEDEAGRKKEILSRIRTGDWLGRQVFPPLIWAVRGLISEGYGLLVGAPKLGKSWFVLSMLLALADGGTALGVIPVDRRPVLYFALEDGDRRMQRRVKKLLGATPIPEGFTYLTRATSEETFDLISWWLEDHPDGVIALDTLGKVLPPARKGQGAYERDYEVGTRLKAMVDAHPGSTLLVVHHDRKTRSGDFMEATSGTNGLNGAADFTIVLSRERNSNVAGIQVTGRDITEGEYQAVLEGGVNWRLDGANLEEAAAAYREDREKEGLGDDQKQVLDFVLGRSHKTVTTAKDVAEHLNWRGEDGRLDNDKAGKYLRRLESGRRIVKVSHGCFTSPPRPVSEVSETAEVIELPSMQSDSSDTSDTVLNGRGVETSSTSGPLDDLDCDSPSLVPAPSSGPTPPSRRVYKDADDWVDCAECHSPKEPHDLDAAGLCIKCAGKEGA